MPDERDATVYHEAGHAVADVLLRAPITKVSIVPDEEDGTLGHAERRAAGDALVRRINEQDIRPRDQERIEASIIAALAGTEAERRYLGSDPDPFGESADRMLAIMWGERISFETGELEAYLAWLRRRAANLFILPWHWAAVEAAAVALLERGTLSGARVHQLVLQAFDAHYGERRRRQADRGGHAGE